MKQYSKNFIIMFLVVSMLMCSCSSQTKSQAEPSSNANFTFDASSSSASAYDAEYEGISEKINLPFDGSRCHFYGFINGNIYYHDFSNLETNEGYLPVLKYGLEKETVYEIGKIENFAIAVDTQVLVENKIYFYITAARPNHLENLLYAIDLNTDKVYLCESESDAGPFITTVAQGENVFSLKSPKPTEQAWTSYIETFNTETAEVDCLIEKTLLKDDGSRIVAMSSYEGNFYTLEQKREGSDSFIFNTYDTEWNIINQIPVTQMNDFMLSNPYEMKIIGGQYVYFRNFGMEYIICEIKSDTLIPVLDGIGVATVNDIQDANNIRLCTKQEYIFLEPGTKDLRTIELNLPNNGTINRILAENNLLLVHITYEDRSSEWFKVTHSELANYDFR